MEPRKFPLIRITVPAHEHLKACVDAESKRTGRQVSMIEFASAILLNLPCGNNHTPPADPCAENNVPADDLPPSA